MKENAPPNTMKLYIINKTYDRNVVHTHLSYHFWHLSLRVGVGGVHFVNMAIAGGPSGKFSYANQSHGAFS